MIKMVYNDYRHGFWEALKKNCNFTAWYMYIYIAVLALIHFRETNIMMILGFVPMVIGLMLARAYRVLDKELPEEAEELPFTDADEIADWAKDSVALLYTWNVLLGRDDGSFDPQGSFTAEQCLITLLRLYENAPVSRKQGNVEQMFTYQQVMELFEHIFTEDNGEIVMSRWDGPGVTALRTMLYGRYSITDTIFVYQDGRCRLVDLGLCNFMGISLNSTAKVTDAAFSEDGSLFRCTVTLPYDSVGRNDSDGVVHQAGIYHVTVDVGTLEATQTWEPLPS